MSRIVALVVLLAALAAFADAGKITFGIIGDWGGGTPAPYYTWRQKRIADIGGPILQKAGSDFTIAIGDNMYNEGVDNEFSPRFKATWGDIYTHAGWQN